MTNDPGADASPFKGIGNKVMITTIGKSRPSKSMSQDSAFQILTKILLNIAEIKRVDPQWISGLLPQGIKVTISGQGIFIPKGSTLTETEQFLIDAALIKRR